MAIVNEAKCVKDNLDLVKAIAAKYATNGLSAEDLEQEGAIGLLIAIRKWDMTLGASLRTYAAPWVLDYIQKAIKRNSARGKVCPPPVSVSFDTASDEGLSLHDTLPGPSESPEQLYSEAEEKHQRAQAIGTLTPREREVLNLRLRDMSLEEVGHITGRSRRRCAEIEAQAIDTLKKRMAS